MSNNGEKSQTGKTIRVGAETSDRLDKLRHKGQSYNGFITELLDLYESRPIKGRSAQSPTKTRNNKNDRS